MFTVIDCPMCGMAFGAGAGGGAGGGFAVIPYPPAAQQILNKLSMFEVFFLRLGYGRTQPLGINSWNNWFKGNHYSIFYILYIPLH